MQNLVYRINNDVLLKIDMGLSERTDYYKLVQNDEEAPNAPISQYLSTYFDAPVVNPEVFESVKSTVWKFNRTLNKVFSEPTPDFDLPDFTIVNEKMIKGQILLRQGFSWQNIFGLLFIVKSANDKVLLSQIYDINDFEIDWETSRELISGSFWVAKTNFTVPNFNEPLFVDIQTVTYDDIDSTIGSVTLGKIFNYPDITSFEPLVGEKPIPDFIQTQLSILPNLYLSIQPITTEENITLEQSIMNYFGITNLLVNVSVRHLISFGNSGDNNFKNIVIENLDNKYGQVKIGLDIEGFNNPMDIFVSTEITVDNKLMVRQSSIVYDFLDTVNPLIAQNIQNPENVYPIEVVNQEVINNNVIETKEVTKIVPIYQKVFSELITENIVFAQKNIYFAIDNTIDYYMKILLSDTEFDILFTEQTVDGKKYFDLTKFSGQILDGGLTYELRLPETTNNTSKIIHQGLILKS